MLDSKYFNNNNVKHIVDLYNLKKSKKYFNDEHYFARLELDRALNIHQEKLLRTYIEKLTAYHYEILDDFLEFIIKIKLKES